MVLQVSVALDCVQKFGIGDQNQPKQYRASYPPWILKRIEVINYSLPESAVDVCVLSGAGSIYQAS
jgi:hypothetical protein